MKKNISGLKNRSAFAFKVQVYTLLVFLVFFINNTSGQNSLSDSIKALHYNREGINAGRLGDFELARHYFEMFKEIRENEFGAASYRLAVPQINIGIQNKNLGEYDRAIENYLTAERLYINEFSTEYSKLGFVYVNLATIYKLKGDYLKAYEYNRNALRLLQKEPQRYANGIIQTQYNVAESLFFMKQYDEAIATCETQMIIVDDDIKSYYTSLLARIYSVLGEWTKADQYYKQTFKLLADSGGLNSFDLGVEYLDYVKFLLATKQYDEIEKYNSLSEQIISKYFSKQSSQYASVMINYGDYYAMRFSEASYLSDFNKKKQDDLERALDYYQAAIIATTSNFNDTDINVNPNLEHAISELQLLEILKKKAHAFSAIGDLKENLNQTTEANDYYTSGLAAMQLAIELVHRIRMGFVSEESKLFLSENQHATFSEAVSLCYKLYRATKDPQYVAKGFELTEKSKSATFLAAVKDSRAKQFGGIPDSLQSREDILKINISNYKEMLYEENQLPEPDSVKLALYNSKIFNYTEQYGQLVKLLEDSFPKYYSFKYANEVVGLNTIREKIKSHDAIVEYLIDEPEDSSEEGDLFRFVITNDEFSFTRTAIDSTFSDNITYLYRFLTDSEYQYTTLNDYQNYVEVAHNLYNKLFSGIREQLIGKKLVVIPDDKLAYIPFDALLYEKADTAKMDFRNLPYLIKSNAVSYTYSSTLLFDYFDNKKKAPKGLLAFAPSYENDDRDTDDLLSYRAGLMPLLAVDQEVENVSQYVKGDIFKDSTAQESAFKALAQEYDILHLAMHTIMNDSLPMYSRLAFAKPTNPNAVDDGWLNTAEIYNMHLNARMAVLSACNTGSGKMQKGEGVMSLARGFLYAGCPSIVMTMWEVEDVSGAEIMSDFYKFLANGKDKDDALRLAKLNHLKNADPLKAHPHFWLAYVAVGNTSPLYYGTDLYFIGIVFFILVAIVFDQIRRRNKTIFRKS